MELVDEEFTNQRNNAVSFGEVEAKKFSQNIRFKDVSFSFGDELPNVLNNMSIDFPVNKSIALVGESGAGKSTLVDLITLLNKPQKGQILIDGIDSNIIKKSSWRNQIGYVAQDTVIFDDTIANNISMWNTETKDSETLNEEIKIAEDCFSQGQVQSKSWLVKELSKLDLNLGTVFLCAGWYGTLATLIFEALCFLKVFPIFDNPFKRL